MSDYTIQNLTSMRFSKNDNWAVLTPIEQRIKAKIEKMGKPLKEWDINIYRGVLTGYNKAFIIDAATKDALIAKSSKNAEIIRPILRGRDIKRYKADFADLWLIYIPWHFPLHNDPTIKGASEIAEREFQKQYPDVYYHLLKHKESLSKRNASETGIRYEWYAMQRFGSNYMEDFSKQKIIYPNMTKYLPFYLDTKGYLQNDKSFMITGKHLSYLTAFLNSSLFKYCFLDNFPELQGGTRELRKIFFDKIPVKKITDDIETCFMLLLNKIQEAIQSNISTKDIELQLDNMIFDIYGLSEEEKRSIGFIEIQ